MDDESKQWRRSEEEVENDLEFSGSTSLPLAGGCGFSSQDMRGFFEAMRATQPSLAFTPLPPGAHGGFLDSLRDVATGFRSLLFVQAKEDVIEPSLVI